MGEHDRRRLPQVRGNYTCLFDGLEHRVQTQQRLTFLGPVADLRQADHQPVVVIHRPGTGEQGAGSGGVGLAELDGTQGVQPVQDLAADPLVVGVLAGVVE
jgi:hypothetical protein